MDGYTLVNNDCVLRIKHNQYTVLKYKIDLYFYNPKLALEIDKYDSCERDVHYEIKR